MSDTKKKSSKPSQISLRFRIHYATVPNQFVVVVGSHQSLGSWDIKKAPKMNYTWENIWQLELSFENKNIEQIEYKYVITDESNGATFWEGGENHTVSLKDYHGPIECRDTFKAANLPESTFLHTTLFEDVIFRRPSQQIEAVTVSPHPDLTVKFRIQTIIAPQHGVFVIGSNKSLGLWDTKKAIPLNATKSSSWGVDVKLTKEEIPFEYKYVVLDLQSKNVVGWEEGNNRRFHGFKKVPFVVKEIDEADLSSSTDTPSADSISTVVCNDIFRKPFRWRGAGIAVPIFSLRTNDGLGVGEFSDLKKLVDFTSKIGGKLIQILPVNDTSCFLTWRDSYPYSSLSVFALHPIYLRLQSLTEDEKILEEIKKEAEVLNKLPQIDYEAVMAAKNKFIAKIFTSKKSAFLKSAEFLKFKEDNKHWLVPYVVFCHLRDKYSTTDYTTWAKEHRFITKEKIEELVTEFEDEASTSYFVQYHLHKQLSEASEYAKLHGIGLKGDLPIGVNRASVDSWVEPRLFHMDMSTGAPPDQFSEDGQNWGFPTYDWDKMKETNYAWWRARLSQMQQYFHAFRIDHVLGFFRIWEIPVDYESGLMGHYNPSIPIKKSDLQWGGIWDIKRLTEPYVKHHLLFQLFPQGEEAQYVSKQFFQPQYDRLVFKPTFDTEKKILEYTSKLNVDTPDAKAWKERLEKGLISLVKNVVLLPSVEDPVNVFYPRVNMYKSSSYMELPNNEKEVLYKLYLDYYYGQKQEDYWRAIGASRLPVIKNATKMLVCGEDLGMVPKCVEPVMNDLGILGLRIQRMPPDPKQEFGYPHSYQYLTVCTPSSHDTSTVRGWWLEDKAKTQLFYNNALGRHGAAPDHCETWVSEQIVVQHLHSPSMFAIFPIQDLFAIEPSLRVADASFEKINEPSNPKHYWRYRMHVTIEQLMAKETYVKQLHELITASGR